MSIELIDKNGNAGEIQSTGEVTIKDFFVYCKGGVPVLSLDAKFDFSGIHPDDHTYFAGILLGRRTRLLAQSDEAYARDAKRSERYRERKAEYEALPWWRRLFARRPWSFDDENG